MNQAHDTTRVETVVVGGGQAGLTVGHELARHGARFVILDASPRVGDAWRNRWDSLRLFTPARFAALPGMRLPLRGDAFPTKDQMADYLEAYARRFQLPVRSCMRVERVTREADRYVLTAGAERFECDTVIIAMADHQQPRVPAFARQLAPGITQLHSTEYRNPSQLRPGGVLVVGAGNSGADIALELARTRPTWLAGKETGHVPFDIERWFARNVLVNLVRFVGHHVLSLATPLGRKLRPQLRTQAAPLVRVGPARLAAAGVKRVARVTGVRDGLPVLADGALLDVANVIWCTGFDPRFPWIDLPVFEPDGEPRHMRGVVPESPGLYFVGLTFQYAMSSATLIGIVRDARWVVRAARAREREVGAARDVATPLPDRSEAGAQVA